MNPREVTVTQPQYRRPVQRRPVQRPAPVTTASNLGIYLVFVAVFALSLGYMFKAGLIHYNPPKTSTSSSSNNKGGGDNGSVSLQLLANAKTYDHLSYVYGGGHPPSDWRSGRGVDCSGLVDVAVLKVTGINENNTARDFRHSNHWRGIDMTDAKAGDIVYLLKENHPGHSDDHVAFVVSNDPKGHTITVFEAATWQTAQPRQIRQASYHYGYFDYALRFKG
jgi:cell wall-associated NlpC family hydrolase